MQYCTYIISFRIMSAMIAVALTIVDPADRLSTDIKPYLELTDIVKLNLGQGILQYLQAIKLHGYESKKKRKMFVIGNTGRKFFMGGGGGGWLVIITYTQKYLNINSLRCFYFIFSCFYI